MKRFVIAALALVVLGLATTSFAAVSFRFTASDIVNTMAAQGHHCPTPITSGGCGRCGLCQPGSPEVGIRLPAARRANSVGALVRPMADFGAAPYTATNSAWFWDAGGSEAGNTPANPLYMIMDVRRIPSRATPSTRLEHPLAPYSPGGGGTLYAPATIAAPAAPTW